LLRPIDRAFQQGEGSAVLAMATELVSSLTGDQFGTESRHPLKIQINMNAEGTSKGSDKPELLLEER